MSKGNRVRSSRRARQSNDEFNRVEFEKSVKSKNKIFSRRFGNMLMSKTHGNNRKALKCRNTKDSIGSITKRMIKMPFRYFRKVIKPILDKE